MRVVVDTNVFISSFLGGNPRRVIDLWKAGRITLCLTNAIIDEYVGVLKRMEFIRNEDIKALLSLFREQFNCVFLATVSPLTVCSDPDDDKFIEAAVALDAEVIISGDDHLKSLKKYMDIRIMPPKEFVKYISALST
jgi:uncharacterized protein